MSLPPTTNMGLVLPEVSVEPGPDYATQNNAAFNVIDLHDHTPGNGVQIPSSGLNINAPLEMNSNALIEALRLEMLSQGSPQAGTNFLHISGGNLFFNDGASNQIRLTLAGAIDVSTTGGFGGDYASTAAIATYVDANLEYNFFDSAAARAILNGGGLISDGRMQWATTAINSNTVLSATDKNHILITDVSGGTVQYTLPDPTLGKRILIIKDETGDSETNNITLARFAAETIDGIAANRVLAHNFGTWVIASDGTNWVMLQDNKTSETMFEGPTGVVAIPLTFTTPTLAAPTRFAGLPVTRAINNLSFPFVGKYEVGIYLAQVDVVAGNSDVIVQLRNTTDATIVEHTITLGGAPAPQSQADSFLVNIPDISKVHQIQWAASSATTVNGNAVDGITGPSWRVLFKRKGNF